MVQNVKIDKLPASVEEFTQIRDQLALTAEGGAAVFILALKLYGENPSLGEQCLVIAIDRSKLQPGNVYKGMAVSNFDMSRLKEQMRQYPYVANSYFAGATPDNGYTVNVPTEMYCSENSHSGNQADGEFKVFVQSAGADSPRPMRMIRNNRGIWKAAEWSSIIMGIVPPKVEIDDDI